LTAICELRLSAPGRRPDLARGRGYAPLV